MTISKTTTTTGYYRACNYLVRLMKQMYCINVSTDTGLKSGMRAMLLGTSNELI